MSTVPDPDASPPIAPPAANRAGATSPAAQALIAPSSPPHPPRNLTVSERVADVLAEVFQVLNGPDESNEGSV
ncbi:hypothetical protein [Planctomycetes bacterium TBK1r]|uniref:Uncharacterized protein n=1 Tax=Stieleria magnilauensis TaxID=2527963 RepID=A0ABX5Y2E5_9BACT|nr:hypothetical protein TBK1r_71240 [Planctomycetes bacterium TBK1r]